MLTHPRIVSETQVAVVVSAAELTEEFIPYGETSTRGAGLDRCRLLLTYDPDTAQGLTDAAVRLRTVRVQAVCLGDCHARSTGGSTMGAAPQIFGVEIDGFDGSWVAHPDLVPVALEVFDAMLGTRPHQLDRLRKDVHGTAAELLDTAATSGQVTDAGLRNNISVAIQYLEAWLRGSGAVAIFDLMKNAATAEFLPLPAYDRVSS